MRREPHLRSVMVVWMDVGSPILIVDSTFRGVAKGSPLAFLRIDFPLVGT